MSSQHTAPPEVSDTRRSKWAGLAIAGLAMSAVGLAASATVILLVITGVIEVPWNAVFLPRLAFSGLIPLSVVGLIVSCVAWFRRRDTRSVVGVVAGILATIASIFALLLVVVTAIAAHPV